MSDPTSLEFDEYEALMGLVVSPQERDRMPFHVVGHPSWIVLPRGQWFRTVCAFGDLAGRYREPPDVEMHPLGPICRGDVEVRRLLIVDPLAPFARSG